MMEVHRQKLDSVCRICNECIQDKGCSKLIFADEFLRLYKIDVWKDDDDTHPPNICSKHRVMFLRAQTAHENGHVYQIKDANANVFIFKSHDEQCSLCFTAEFTQPKVGRGRPSKRRAGSSEHPRQSLDSTFSSSVTPGPNRNVDDAKKLFTNLKDEEKRELLSFVVDHLSDEQLCHMSVLTASKIKKSVQASAKAIKCQYKTINTLLQNNTSNCVEKANPVLIAFLKTLCTVQDLSDTRQLYHLAQTIEAIYRLCDSRLITPLAFMTNLQAYVYGGSRSIVDLLRVSTGGGCYDAIKDWLTNLASKPVHVPEADLGHAFDNNQKIGRPWSVSVDNNKFRTSVITTHIWFPLGPSLLQYRRSLKPYNWTIDKDIIEKIRQEEDPVFQELNKIHLDSLSYFVKSAIELVKSEQTLDVSSNTYKDKIDQLNESRHSVTCSKCLADGISISYPKSKRKCDVCQSPLVKCVPKNELAFPNQTLFSVDVTKNFRKTPVSQNPVIERYGQIPATIPNSIPKPIIGEPTFVDPNSYVTCTKVLRKIGTEAGIIFYGTGKREWLVIVCDGLPFRLCHVIITSTYFCTLCKVSLFRNDEVDRHCFRFHDGNKSTLVLEFDWVFLKPAGGHFEMNSIKAFFELNWDTFLSQLCEVMGYKSEAAKHVAKTCKDHHKAWELILIFFLGTLRELITVYAREMGDAPLSTNGFFQFTKEKSNNPNFLYIFSQVATYAFAIVNFRMGMRRNNHMVMLSAVSKICGLFHGRNHPFYQLIEVYYMAQLFEMHGEVEANVSTVFNRQHIR